MTVSLHGILTPLITPIDSDEAPDLRSMRRLVDFQIENGIHGLWAMGTSAEFAGFDEGERAAVVETVIEAARGRVPVVANISDASARLSIRHARRAAAAGATAIAATPPYYYPHSQDEVLAHYRAIRQAVDLPLLIYNIPQTVRVRVELSTAKTLAEEGTVSGIKDSQNDLEWFRQLVLFTRQRSIAFRPFVGTRYLIDAGVLAGACGAIPSLANAFPALCVATYEAASAGNVAEASRLEDRIIEIESVAGLVAAGSRNAAILGFLKAMLHRKGIIDDPGLTQPLRSLTPEEQERAWELTERRDMVASAQTEYAASPD
jgi:4-hydroxy-tetrahydrodipicolinate synthase